MMHRVVLTAGTGYSGAGKPLSSAQRERALRNIRKEILRRADGYSEFVGFGAWRSPEGTAFAENNVRWEILLDTTYDGSVYSIGRQLANHIAAELDQRSVMLEVSEVYVEFVSQGGAE